MEYSQTIDEIIDKEKGYVNHPSDRGGPTNFGITEAVARQNGYKGEMIHLPRQKAVHIYLDRYVLVPNFDKIYRINPDIGNEVIDTGVNMGPATAAMFFQRLLNAMNARGSRYSDLFVDGRIGNASIEALTAYVKWRGPEGVKVLVKALNHIQGGRYLDIAEKNETQEDFFYGWILSRT